MSRSWSRCLRREERIHVALPVTLRTGWERATVVECNALDYSPRGLRVRANVPFRVRQDVEIVLSDNHDLARKYSVMWVREPDPGHSSFEAGLEVQGEGTG